MHLSHAFVADAAAITVDGKVWMLGGDFDTIVVPEFPAVHMALALVVKLVVQPTECERDHVLRMEFIEDDGVRVIPSVQLPFRVATRPDRPHRPVGIALVVNLQQQRFEKPGTFAFHILVDDLELGVVPFYLERACADTAGTGIESEIP